MIKQLAYFLFTLFMVQTGITLGQKKQPDEKKRLEFENAFMNAHKEVLTGNNEKALVLFEKCIDINPEVAAPYYRLADLNKQKRNLAQALNYSEQAIKIDPGNKWFYLQKAGIYVAMKQYTKAAGTYKELIKLIPAEQQFYEEAANLYASGGDYSSAVKIYEKLEKIIGVTEDVSLQKERLYLAQKKPAKAMAEIQKLIDAYPEEVRYWGMMAEIYSSTNQPEKAYEMYQKILQKDPGNGLTHFALSEYWRERGEQKKAFQEIKLAFTDKGVDLKSKLSVMSAYLGSLKNNKELKEEAYSLAEILIENHPTEAQPHVIYGDILARDKQFKEARDQYQLALLIEQNNVTVWNQLIICSAELKQYDRMASDCEKALEVFPDIAEIYLYASLAYLQQKQYEAAEKAAHEGAEIAAVSVQVQVQLLANLGDAANFLKHYKTSDSAYEAALVWDPSNTYVLNNYAYFLSVRNVSLEKAAQMSKQTLEQEPESASYLDTYGWILYQQGKYNEAKPYLEKAVEKAKESSEVNEHMGDLYFRLGNITKALEYWKIALNLGSDHGLLLEKKIREQKISE